VRLAFLDLESTGLYLDLGHQIWDAGTERPMTYRKVT